ncbi:conserved hypothetical protein [Lebetimonas natsushimae]|uniref:Uncharacterized protein n=1 Tax=Lebetimonas natsushimae TaxID=1936991 RepID=A0A292YEX2_9BACT|nr:hypothetical protein [Lebetimonas natsushimae]GAX87781.1 conserved hypothetical protein [Lebetimonas natsushimae]
MLKFQKLIHYLTLPFLFITNVYSFYIGVGGFSVCEYHNKTISTYSKKCLFKKRKNISYFLKKELPNVNAISIWITKDWKEYWYPAKTINNFIKKGYTPIFIFYWFGDDISPEFVKKNKNNYLNAIKKFSKFLQKINGEKIIIFNPEFNENNISEYKKFDYLQAKSILDIKEKVKNTKIGICFGDFGIYDRIWDNENWDYDTKNIDYSVRVSDFVAFQEMRAVTKNKKKEILNTPERALAFSIYLYQKYKKPTFLAYLAISSYKNDKIQTQVIKKLNSLLPLFKKSAHLIGINYFNYIDNPLHKGYFNIAEKYWGLKTKDGKEKPAFFEFKKIK